MRPSDSRTGMTKPLNSWLRSADWLPMSMTELVSRIHGARTSDGARFSRIRMPRLSRVVMPAGGDTEGVHPLKPPSRSRNAEICGLVILADDPGGHAALALYHGGLERIHELPAELPGELHEEALVHKIAIGTVRKSIPPARNWTDLLLHPDGRRQPAEQQATGSQHLPGAPEHGVELGVVPGKVQDGAA